MINKLIVIGIDGMDFDVVKKYEDMLPTLSKMPIAELYAVWLLVLHVREQEQLEKDWGTNQSFRLNKSKEIYPHYLQRDPGSSGLARL